MMEGPEIAGPVAGGSPPPQATSDAHRLTSS